MAEKEYTVYFPVYAEYAVKVKLDPDEFDDEEELNDAIIEAGYDNMPSGPGICCTGWSFEEWSLEMDPSSSEAHYVYDNETRKVIWGDPEKKLGW